MKSVDIKEALLNALSDVLESGKFRLESGMEQ